jgi:signal transduction histidine kinase
MAREEERRRLRRRLHDGIGPTLAAMAIQLDVARDQVAADPDAAVATLGRVKEQTQGVLADIRGLARELRPPALDELGLVGALRQRAAELSAGSTPAPTSTTPTSTPRIEVAVEDALPTLPAAVEVAAYRIATEAMLNAIHHGQATACWVRLSLHGPLVVEIEDDGVGLDVDGRSGVGIHAMHERATELGGTLAIGPRDGGGTRVLATLPWQA